ncbi:hypothetical protein Dcae01_02723 [Deinococcus caeni]|uniref:Uncharacterized protein n=1 Tax=Deinococcus caeni TaxID=569127 RepID=A0ABP9UG30_9DEIO
MQYLPTHPGAVRAQALLNEAAQARQARLAQAAARAQADRQPAHAVGPQDSVECFYAAFWCAGTLKRSNSSTVQG